MKKNFNGVVAALVTPFTRTGAINHNELKRLVRYLINQHIDGFYVGGSTSEAFLLSQDERKEILETVVAENNGDKFIVAHVGHISTDFAIELAQHAKSCGVDAVSAINPFYYKFSTEEVLDYYRDIALTSRMPLFIYNFPDFSGFSFTNDMLCKLREDTPVIGVKFTSKDFYEMERMKSANADLTIWNGYDEMLLSGLAAGADGGVGSTYCCILPIIKGIYDSFGHKDIQAAQSYQRIANDFIDVIVKYGVYASIKTILGFDGLNFGSCRKPFKTISEQGVAELRAVYEKYRVTLKS